MKTLVLYVFHEYHERVQNFIDQAIFQADDVDFIMISNDKSISFEAPSYVKKFFRDNIGFDFGGWSDGLLTDDLYKNYDNFIFVNSSVIGPFVKDSRWTDMYLSRLSGNIKLFGSTINTCGVIELAHVQSYAFAMNRETVEFLISKGIFSLTDYVRSFRDAIWKREVRMSRYIVGNGWNIGSFLKHYDGVDFTSKSIRVPLLNDVMFQDFRNKVWTDYDLIFIKGNRKFYDDHQVKDTTIFLLHHNEDISEFEHPCITPLQVKKGCKYYESQIFNELDEIPDTEFLGFITPSVFKKYGKRDLNELVKQVQSIKPDTIVPYAYNPNLCPGEAAQWHSPLFVSLWSWLIEEMGYSRDTNDKYHVICCNMWFAPRHLFVKYIAFARKAMNIIENAPKHIQEAFFSDSGYRIGKAGPQECLEKFGVPHYPFHPFIIERLISFFKYLEEQPSFDFVDKIVYINLAKRTDRRVSIEGVLKDVSPAKISRFDAIRHEKGAVGCSMSHKAVIELAIKNGWKNCLVLEDDAVWGDVRGYRLLKKLATQPFDVITLGTTFTDFDLDTHKLHSGQTTTAYLISQHYYQTYLDNLNAGLEKLIETGDTPKYALDIYWKQLQARDNWYCVMPCLMTQKEGYSDIEKAKVDYTKMFNLVLR